MGKELKNDFNNNFDFNRFVDAADWNEKVHSRLFIQKPYAFSVDNFFVKSQLSRKNSDINFKTREQLKIGQINSLQYGWAWDTPLRRILPYYVFFEIPKYFKTGNICTEGKVFYQYSEKKLNYKYINDSNFQKLESKTCLELNDNNKYLYIIGYSINDKDNLRIKFESNLLLLIKSIKYFLTFVYLICLFNIYKPKFNTSLIVYIVSVFSSIILALIRDPNTFLSLRYFRGGADGIVHYSWSRKIVENLYNNNYLEALKGSEEIFILCLVLDILGVLIILYLERQYLAIFLFAHSYLLFFYKIFELLFSKKLEYFCNIIYFYSCTRKYGARTLQLYLEFCKISC